MLIIGLGNPGEKFKNTRHNAGFMAVDFFAKENGFPEFEFSKKFDSLISQKDDITLSKPQIFMNESGKAVKKLVTGFKLQALRLVVVHDDIDLPLGNLKMVKNRGSAGHKGVESIIRSVGNKELVRLRIGVQPTAGKPKNPENFVIKNFTKEEMEIMEKVIKKTAGAINYLIENGLERTMNEYN